MKPKLLSNCLSWKSRMLEFNRGSPKPAKDRHECFLFIAFSTVWWLTVLWRRAWCAAETLSGQEAVNGDLSDVPSSPRSREQSLSKCDMFILEVSCNSVSMGRSWWYNEQSHCRRESIVMPRGFLGENHHFLSVRLLLNVKPSPSSLHDVSAMFECVRRALDLLKANLEREGEETEESGVSGARSCGGSA